MRLKRNRLKLYNHRSAIPKKDKEGNSSIEYGPPSSFSAEVWPAGGKMQSEMYGQRITGIWNCRLEGKYDQRIGDRGRCYYCVGEITICEGDGICLYVDESQEPDYQIIAIRPNRFLTLEVEKL